MILKALARFGRKKPSIQPLRPSSNNMKNAIGESVRFSKSLELSRKDLTRLLLAERAGDVASRDRLNKLRQSGKYSEKIAEVEAILGGDKKPKKSRKGQNRKHSGSSNGFSQVSYRSYEDHSIFGFIFGGRR